MSSTINDPTAPTSATVFRLRLRAGRRCCSFQHEHQRTRKVLRIVRKDVSLRKVSIPADTHHSHSRTWFIRNFFGRQIGRSALRLRNKSQTETMSHDLSYIGMPLRDQFETFRNSVCPSRPLLFGATENLRLHSREAVA